jgi:hypothetical protein
MAMTISTEVGPDKTAAAAFGVGAEFAASVWRKQI